MRDEELPCRLKGPGGEITLPEESTQRQRRAMQNWLSGDYTAEDKNIAVRLIAGMPRKYVVE